MNAQFCHSGLKSPEGMPGYACGQVEAGPSFALTSCTLTATKPKRRAREESAFLTMLMSAKSWPRANGTEEKEGKENLCEDPTSFVRHRIICTWRSESVLLWMGWRGRHKCEGSMRVCRCYGDPSLWSTWWEVGCATAA